MDYRKGENLLYKHNSKSRAELVIVSISFLVSIYLYVEKISNIIIISILSISLIYIMWINRKMNKRLYNIAFLDDITQIGNYNYFIIECERYAKKQGYRDIALIYLDIDKFKLINDKYEYEYGNRVLRAIGQIIKTSFKEDDVFCRSCNNDFMILHRYDGQIENLKHIVEDLIDKIRSISLEYDDNLDIKPSLGVYIISKEDTDIKLCIDKAGIAKSQVKGNRINKYAFYDTELRTRLIEEKEIEKEMEKSLSSKEFEIFLQLKYDMKNENIVGSEALIRWNNKAKGLISPEKFIPLFEKNKFIKELDIYVFREVCSLISKWTMQNIYIYPVSVNISRVSLENEELVKKLDDIIKEFGISSNSIQIEITESAFFEKEDKLKSIIDKFRDVGFKVSIDDFGAGYSSLNMLKNIVVDEIKLDKGFLSNISNDGRSHIIIFNMINMAHQLNTKIVAEGVETFEQREYLRNIGCDIGQGYLYSKPITINEYEKIIKENIID